MRIVVFSILFAAGLFFSCSCQKDLLVPGVYSIDNRGNNHYKMPVDHRLQLEEDSTFHYIYHGGFHMEVSSGRWLQGARKNEILLLSDITNVHSIPINVVESVYNDSTTTFIFSNPLGKDTVWKLKVNGEDYLFQEGVVKIEGIIQVEDISLMGFLCQPDSSSSIIPYPIWDSLASSNYHITDRNSNLFYIAFAQPIDFNIYYYVPVEETVRINKHSLRFKENYYCKIRKEK